jgi:hypothetical protein
MVWEQFREVLSCMEQLSSGQRACPIAARKRLRRHDLAGADRTSPQNRSANGNERRERRPQLSPATRSSMRL